MAANTSCGEAANMAESQSIQIIISLNHGFIFFLMWLCIASWSCSPRPWHQPQRGSLDVDEVTVVGHTFLGTIICSSWQRLLTSWWFCPLMMLQVLKAPRWIALLRTDQPPGGDCQGGMCCKKNLQQSAGLLDIMNPLSGQCEAPASQHDFSESKLHEIFCPGLELLWLRCNTEPAAFVNLKSTCR